ncbi:MAG: alpha-ketoacid dehydrogenase subunit beta, partial [Deltaproteobacteria bacterium]|nr:alpha-ketoacid dehydrogenase subunit beta [Deltaproteobacteria bacterium]
YPSTPADTKGLLASAIRGEDPVIFLEPKRLYRTAKGEVPTGEHTVPIGQARIVRRAAARSDRSVTILAWGAMVQVATEAADKGASLGYDVEVIDLRTLLPFDIEAILQSVHKTGRVVIVHEAPRTCGFGAELCATIQERALLHLEAPILRVTGFDTPFPYTLESEYLPDSERVLDALQRVTTG